MSKKSQQAMFDAAYNIKQIKKIEQLEADNTKLVEVSARLLNENASLVELFKQVSDRVFPGHTDSVGAVREIVAENAELREAYKETKADHTRTQSQLFKLQEKHYELRDYTSKLKVVVEAVQDCGEHSHPLVKHALAALEGGE